MLRHHLLDLLVDGPSSFAALLGALLRHHSQPVGFGVEEALDELSAMESEGKVRSRMMTEEGAYRDATAEDHARARARYQASLGTAGSEDLSMDAVGLWYEVTPHGRTEWKRWSKGHGHDYCSRWVLDDDAGSRTITIQAESVGVAEEALGAWLAANPNIELVEESRRIERLHESETREGGAMPNGVKIIFRYGLRRPPDASTAR